MPEITLPQGTISYRDTGEGPPVVFIHGLLVDGALWRKVTPLLDGTARSIVPDLPLGSHRTAMNADADVTPHGVARLVGDFLAALGLEDVTLVGNDTGGLISQLVALDHGERVGRLVLTNCDCFEVFPPKEFVPMVKSAHIPGAVKAALAPMRAAAARRTVLAYGGLAREIPDEVTAGWIEPARTDAAVRGDLIRFMKAVDKSISLDAAQRLPELRIPSLVAWAQDDRFFPRELGERLAATLPNARLEPIANSRTFVSEDQPEALADLIRGFVRETAPQAA
ncbi:MAG TPA: alpha/beta hydrolase [Solirubrobacteraceae bacterium]|nr:alpha/beta hydrolase [Solirubrobacteraceae bacterium]